MKKIVLILLVALFTLTLSGCGENLENPYFENTEEETWEDTEELFVSYMFKLKSHYEEYNKHGDLRPNINNYIEYEATTLSEKDVLVKDDFVNYRFSNDLDYMTSLNLMNVYNRIEDIVYLIQDHCSDMREGKICSNEDTEISFYRDGWNLLVQYTENKNKVGQEIYDLYFTRNEDNLVTFDGKILLYQEPDQEAYKFQTISYIEGVEEISEEITRNLDDPFISENTVYTRTSIDIIQNIYTYFMQNSDYEISGYYNPHYDFYQEISWHYANTEFYNYKFTQYRDDIRIYQYDEEENNILLNLMEFQGWDSLVRANEEYTVYLEQQQVLTQPIVVDGNTFGEYPYVQFQGVSQDDTSYFTEVEKLFSGLNYEVLSLGKAEYILSYANMRAYMTENRTLDESFNIVYNQFDKEEESK